MIKKIITLLLFIQCVYTQNNTPIVLIGGIAHIGNEEVIENSTIIIVNGKIDKIGPKKSVEFDENNVEIINIQDKHIYPSFILPNTTLGLAEIDAVRASRDEREVGDFNANVRSQIAYNTESIVLSTVRTNGILLAQVTPRGGLITGTSSIMKLAGDNWKKATYLKDDGLHINWPETYHHDHWTHSHDFTAKDTDLDKENDGKKKNQKAIAQLYNFFDNARQYNLLKEKEIDLRFEALQNITIENRWSGIMGFSYDGLPLMGALPSYTSTLVAAGFTGHGFGFAQLVGEEVAQIAIEGSSKLSKFMGTHRL